MSTKKVRVRFAPSPTGPLHMGGVRTALYNYLFAKKNGGEFILRIEDTDQTRFVSGAEQYITESLQWCGLEFDEGIEKGGQYAPYRQSERKEMYRKYALQLIDSGKAYYAFDTPEDLDEMRKRLESEKAGNTSYNSAVRDSMCNSLVLSKEETQTRITRGDDYVIRFKMFPGEEVTATDLIRNNVTFNTSVLDDKVLFKSDGMPTYHLANVVDDYLMKISHVIRGEEWLPSLPLHILLYEALGWEDSMPEFAHLPLLLKPSGNGKLSKRDGDKLGFPVFPIQWNDPSTGEISSGYREAGYFPEAFVSMLALLGWNPGTEQEFFTLDELASKFSLERVSKSGARFDPEKAKWFNHHYMVEKDNTELAGIFQKELELKGISKNTAFIARVCGLVKERANLLTDLWEQSSFFFVAPDDYDEKIVRKKWKENSAGILTGVKELLLGSDEFTRDIVEPLFKAHLEKNSIGFGEVMNILRLVLVGGAKGPDLFEIIITLGKEETCKRIETGIQSVTESLNSGSVE